MDEIMVIYWSQTGNTEAMAYAIGRGIEQAGKKAKVLPVSEASMEEVKIAPILALGCPAMGTEVLEESEMEPFVAELENYVKDKQIALFGSYGWGSGEWMKDWEERMKTVGAILIHDQGIIAEEAPTEEIFDECETLGKEMANSRL